MVDESGFPAAEQSHPGSESAREAKVASLPNPSRRFTATRMVDLNHYTLACPFIHTALKPLDQWMPRVTGALPCPPDMPTCRLHDKLAATAAQRAHIINTMSPRFHNGFTLLELMIALVIAAALVAIAIPSYAHYREQMRINRAEADVAEIALALQRYHSQHFTFPATLADLGMAIPADPWGNPYQYLPIDITPPPNKGKVRKDKSLNPLNSDFDLYSMGPDGQTRLPLTASTAKDDIVRAGNGSFIGIASDY